MSMKIGEVAKRTDLAVSAIRYYESIGLVKPVNRSESGYRLYDPKCVDRILFIRKAQQSGLELQQISELLNLQGKEFTSQVCKTVQALIQRRRNELSDRIQKMQQMDRALQKLEKACVTRGVDFCPAISSLIDETMEEKSAKTQKTKPGKSKQGNRF
ncbi:MAG TPA: zinc-responsive transcriptional regulator [Leptospiraceae bacterium]|nr:zinc-responsive transcriptional regulator [Spirochaetaceae bacterium]HBS05393.1 zinc-responsive transcriptional regulator [Leptospiraceae bacterium]|tara:strand:- start:2729 stop:3199 length:471 start_codon:yes stop_codon:yes gene_type:complete